MPSLFKRSLIRAGNGALLIVLPRSWVDYHGLQPRDVVEVKTNRNLVVYPKVIVRRPNMKSIKRGGEIVGE